MVSGIEGIRADFPILSTKVNGKPLVYLDSAATTQRPRQVVDAVSAFYSSHNANVARGLYSLAETATLEYEAVRDKARSFVNARGREELIFTKNTTESANLVMRGWGEKFVKKGKHSKIVVTVMEHHSNFVPWQQLARQKGARFEVVDITDNGLLDESDLEKKLRGADLFAFSGASNVLGTINDVRKFCAMARDAGAISVVDGAQSVPSLCAGLDVKKYGCDFLMFSGHKMLAPFGVGVLYGRREFLEIMDPFIYGSEMIRTVSERKSEWNAPPQKFEPGTPDVGAVIGLGAAIDYLRQNVGLENVVAHERSLSTYLLKRLGELGTRCNIRILGPHGPKDSAKRLGLVSFAVEGRNPIHPHDIAAILDGDGIAVRSGHHCAMPLHSRLGVAATTRASTYIYNTASEIDAFAESLERAIKLFR